MDKQVIIIGYADHAKVVCDILRAMGRQVVGYCDNEEKGDNPNNLAYLGKETDEKVLDILKDHDCFVAIGDNGIRERVGKFLIENNVYVINAIHPSAIVSSSAQLGTGVMLGPGVLVNAFAKIQDGVICNTGSIIEHDCEIGAYAHLAPGSVLCGGVKIGQRTLFGAGAVSILYISIGNDVTIGAGTVVIRDIADNKKVAGNPQKEI